MPKNIKAISSFTSRAPAETQEFGKLVFREIKKLPALVLLDGPLGAGKTHFAQGFVSGFLKKKTVVTSPSYSLVNAYKSAEKTIYHIDLYRLNSTDDLESIGFWDFCDGKNIILVEWADKLPHVWPETIPIYQVKIKILSESAREFALTLPV